MSAEEVARHLSPPVAEAYRRCFGRLAPEVLESRMVAHLAALEARAEDQEFLDLATARRVASLCRRMLAARSEGPAVELVAAAVAYFLLEHDGEPDASIIGFDDDLDVARATALVLGLDPDEEGA